MRYQWLGLLLRVAARFTPGDAGTDLDHLARELLGLDRRARAQRRATSR